MPTSDRHSAALSSATETYRATPVGPSALPRLSAHALDAERARLARELDRLVGERAAIESSIDEAELERERARSEVERSHAASVEIQARQVELTAAATAAAELLAHSEERRNALAASLQNTNERVDVLHQVCDGLGETLATVTCGSLTPPQLASTADDLERFAERTGAVGSDAAATALRDWASALRNGTAPLQPSATEMLGALADLERRWDEHGRGDLMSDPAVAALRCAVDEARAVRDEIESQASSGALGEQTLGTIRAANARRTELEDRRNKAEVDELQAARDAETEALRVVGFDSMLDLHIALSTGGTGTLVDAQRATAATRLAELESELAMLLATTVALHAELQVRFDELCSRADELVGGLSGRSIDDALRGLLAVPDPVRDAATGLQVTLQSSQSQLATDQREHDELLARMPALDLRSAVASAAASHVALHVDGADLVHHGSTTMIADRERTVEDLREQWSAAESQVTATTAAVEELATRTYLAADRDELRRALISTLLEHARWLASGAGSDDGSSATAMVVDDPLDDLTDTDAIAVLDDLVSVAWPLPVVYVTSRAALVLRLRQNAGHLVCVDGRRRPRTSHRWLKRPADADRSLQG